ncbi:MAG: sigma-54-dependent Fis family transcriptional regulator, partial [Candidatus Brocadiae bacterium]|nr:sigma-54-dependent Fis family transcriptional regulator [Candidatus Brocadiia bacterium]
IHSVKGISDEAMRVLADYEWPGNVRELENVLQRAVVLCRTPYILPEDLPTKLASPVEPVLPDGKTLALKEAMRRWERHLILEGLKANGGNRKETAKCLGINRTTLYNKMREYGITEI